jgi:hypothetical protein
MLAMMELKRLMLVVDRDLIIWRGQIEKKKFRGGKTKDNTKFRGKI